MRPESRRVAAHAGSWNGFWIVVLIDALWGMGLSTQFSSRFALVITTTWAIHCFLGRLWPRGGWMQPRWLPQAVPSPVCARGGGALAVSRGVHSL